MPKKAKKAKKFLKINASTGKVTVKKGLPKGKYVVKVTMSAAANVNYNAAPNKTIKLTVTVK